jgi:hypothetical protein
MESTVLNAGMAAGSDAAGCWAEAPPPQSSTPAAHAAPGSTCRIAAGHRFAKGLSHLDQCCASENHPAAVSESLWEASDQPVGIERAQAGSWLTAGLPRAHSAA